MGSIDPSWRATAGVKHNKERLGKFANDDHADRRKAWALFSGFVAYVWHAGQYASTVQEALAAADFEVRAQIIWAKDRFAANLSARKRLDGPPRTPAPAINTIRRSAGETLDQALQWQLAVSTRLATPVQLTLHRRTWLVTLCRGLVEPFVPSLET
jgi:hypothetical protein